MKRATPAEVATPEVHAEARRIMDATAREFAPLNAARYATPGTPENNAYHAKLDEISAMAEAIRRNREGR